MFQSFLTVLVALFATPAFAQASAQQGDPFMAFLPLVLLFVVFYFLLIRPQQKKTKEHRKMVEALAKGNEVITNGGMLGKVTDLDENYVTLKLAEGVEVKCQRAAIMTVLPKGTIKSL